MKATIFQFGALLALSAIGVERVGAIEELFKPWEYEKRIATCKAIKRGPTTATVDIDLRYVDINPDAQTTILMVHGWPGLWSTWSKQIQEFKNDYHLVVPDIRGFGESGHPGDVRSSGTLNDIANDLVCVLEHAGVSNAICMGHDWGSAVCYEAARQRPDVFKAVVGAVVPYTPAAGPFLPIQSLIGLFPSFSYQLFFDGKLDAAINELDLDIERSLRATLRTVDNPPPDQFLRNTETFLGAWDGIDISPIPFFTREEEQYFVDQYKINGFKNTLQFYTTENRHLNWENANQQGNHTLPQPVLAIFPQNDPVADWVVLSQLSKSSAFIPSYSTRLIPGAHWVHLENPEEFNSAVRDWLNKLPA